MSSQADRSAVRVMIFGEEYQIRTELGEACTQECARFVDDAIQEAHVGGAIKEPHRAAILAALKITDELFRARREVDALTEAVRSQVEELADKLEAVAGSVEEAAELSLDV